MSRDPLRRDTLTALEAARREREQQLKEDERVLASRGVQRFWIRHGWPEEDLHQVLDALGISKVEINVQEPDTSGGTVRVPGGGTTAR